eukprot:COSAG05_NODE_6702_length_918_cov_1.476190_1_plen_171_part_01
MEELDNPGEFFFDNETSKLYLYHNGTGAPPATATVVVPQKQILLNISGTQFDPVKNTKHTGISFTASAYTYMMPHGAPLYCRCRRRRRRRRRRRHRCLHCVPIANVAGVPSAGDWALDRYGAIFLQGTEGTIIDSCTIERIDGNGVMVSGYNRNATIQHSEFAYVGGNAIA